MSTLSPVVSKSLCVMVSLHMGHHVLLSLSIVAVYIKASDNEAILYTNTHPCTHTGHNFIHCHCLFCLCSFLSRSMDRSRDDCLVMDVYRLAPSKCMSVAAELGFR